MFDTHKKRTKLFFFDCLKDSAGAALKNAAPAPTNKSAPAPQHCNKLKFWSVFLPLKCLGTGTKDHVHGMVPVIFPIF